MNVTMKKIKRGLYNMNHYSHRDSLKGRKNAVLSSQLLTKAYQQANHYKGSHNMYYLMQYRLDMSLFYIGLTKSIKQSRRFIRHQKVFVNDFPITQTGHLLEFGDIVNLSARKPIDSVVRVPLHFEISYALQTAIFLYSPQKIYSSKMILLDQMRR